MIKQCTKCKNYDISITDAPCRECQTAYHLTGHKPNFKSTLTNADRIRAMTDEELAEYMTTIGSEYPCPENGMIPCRGTGIKNCKECWLDYLKQEAKE